MYSIGREGIFDQYRRLISMIIRLLDGAVVMLMLGAACWFHEVPFNDHYIAAAAFSFLLVLTVFSAAQLYRPWRGVYLLRLVRKVCLAWVAVAAILAFTGYITKTSSLYSRRVMISWLALGPFAVVAFRLGVYTGLRWLRSQGKNARTVVIAGAGHLGRRLAENIVETLSLGMRLLGFFDDFLVGQKIELQPGNESYAVLGDLDDMVKFVQKQKVHMVYLALPMRAETRLRQVVEALQDTTASVYFVPDVFTFSLLHASITDLRGIPLISLWESPFYGVNGWLKRAEDIVLASLFLLSIWPLMLLIALGVKFSSPGPILFKQRRYGVEGEEFWVYKFRTMTVCEDSGEIFQATQNDSRVTRFGAFLRRTSLDELPQLFNVLQGSMSIVGPRPHAVAHNEYYRSRIPGYMLRHKVRPGLTGLAQINGYRGETDTLEKMHKRIQYDLDYLVRWSLWLDVKIIFITAFRVLKDKYAY